MKKYFSYKDGFTDALPNINQTDYLQVVKCEHTEKEVLQLYYFGMDTENALCLHSEDERNTQKSVKLFKQENPNFCKYLEFFTEDNPIRFNQIINKHYETR